MELSSDEFQRQLQPFLFDQTQHFIHEFTSFAQSPFDMTAYDERAQYNWPNNESRDQVRDTPTVFHSHTSGVDQLLLTDIIMCVVRLLYSQHWTGGGVGGEEYAKLLTFQALCFKLWNNLTQLVLNKSVVSL